MRTLPCLVCPMLCVTTRHSFLFFPQISYLNLSYFFPGDLIFWLLTDSTTLRLLKTWEGYFCEESVHFLHEKEQKLSIFQLILLTIFNEVQSIKYFWDNWERQFSKILAWITIHDSKPQNSCWCAYTLSQQYNVYFLKVQNSAASQWFLYTSGFNPYFLSTWSSIFSVDHHRLRPLLTAVVVHLGTASLTSWKAEQSETHFAQLSTSNSSDLPMVLRGHDVRQEWS